MNRRRRHTHTQKWKINNFFPYTQTHTPSPQPHTHHWFLSFTLWYTLIKYGKNQKTPILLPKKIGSKLPKPYRTKYQCLYFCYQNCTSPSIYMYVEMSSHSPWHIPIPCLISPPLRSLRYNTDNECIFMWSIMCAVGFYRKILSCLPGSMRDIPPVLFWYGKVQSIIYRS